MHRRVTGVTDGDAAMLSLSPHYPSSVRRYRLDADSPCAMRDWGQKDRRRQLQKAVSQSSKAVVKVMTVVLLPESEHGARLVDCGRLVPFSTPTCIALIKAPEQVCQLAPSVSQTSRTFLKVLCFVW